MSDWRFAYTFKSTDLPAVLAITDIKADDHLEEKAANEALNHLKTFLRSGVKLQIEDALLVDGALIGLWPPIQRSFTLKPEYRGRKLLTETDPKKCFKRKEK